MIEDEDVGLFFVFVFNILIHLYFIRVRLDICTNHQRKI